MNDLPYYEEDTHQQVKRLMATTQHPHPREDKHAMIERLFAYHPPKGDQQERYQQITSAFKELGHLLADLIPDTADLTVAVRQLHLARMLANAAIACNE